MTPDQPGPASTRSPAAGRVLGLDLGSRRIGVAVSDAGRTLASPLTVVERGGDPAADHRRLAALAVEEEAVAVVVGLPRSLDGGEGPAARAVREEVAALAAVLQAAGGIPVELVDERLTTVEAHRRLAESGLRARQRRKVVDRAAATLLLQAWLDRRRP